MRVFHLGLELKGILTTPDTDIFRPFIGFQQLRLMVSRPSSSQDMRDIVCSPASSHSSGPFQIDQNLVVACGSDS